MAITGAHLLFYTPEAEALRKTLGDVFGWSGVDAGGGWMIYATPPGEIGVHPGDKPGHQISLMCDDLPKTIAELEAKGIEFKGEPHSEDFGHTAMMVLPGGVEVMLYEPLHPTAI
ncbi:MAG: hypothetical protein HKN07_16170 [Acidimicrobiia bacterium]|nr:hypothetical protein [Acidimicrobiia bacterium]